MNSIVLLTLHAARSLALSLTLACVLVRVAMIGAVRTPVAASGGASWRNRSKGRGVWCTGMMMMTPLPLPPPPPPPRGTAERETYFEWQGHGNAKRIV
uniref:Putative secreted protein n=1 Tax=Anopheles darlingi TaxID=43151 RepID=A0A2M4DDJ3_ANODA